MTNLSSIFDGVIDNDIPVKPPIAVLKELANEFEKLTKGLLIADIKQGYYQSNFFIEFYINAPSFNNYTYKVFSVFYELGFYPLNIYCSSNSLDAVANSQEELEALLKQIFSSSEVKKVINGLLAQIKFS